jgi:hypothetical protein
MSKVAHAAKLAYLRRLCLAIDSMHAETARLVASMTNEPRSASSAASLKPKPRKSSKL